MLCTEYPLLLHGGYDGCRFLRVSMGQNKIHMVMPGNVIHIPALGKQIVNFAKNGITNNLRDPLLNQRLGTRSAILLSLHASKRLSFVKSRVAK